MHGCFKTRPHHCPESRVPSQLLLETENCLAAAVGAAQANWLQESSKHQLPKEQDLLQLGKSSQWGNYQSHFQDAWKLWKFAKFAVENKCLHTESEPHIQPLAREKKQLSGSSRRALHQVFKSAFTFQCFVEWWQGQQDIGVTCVALVGTVNLCTSILTPGVTPGLPAPSLLWLRGGRHKHKLKKCLLSPQQHFAPAFPLWKPAGKGGPF